MRPEEKNVNKNPLFDSLVLLVSFENPESRPERTNDEKNEAQLSRLFFDRKQAPLDESTTQPVHGAPELWPRQPNLRLIRPFSITTFSYAFI